MLWASVCEHTIKFTFVRQHTTLVSNPPRYTHETKHLMIMEHLERKGGKRDYISDKKFRGLSSSFTASFPSSAV